MVFQKSCKPFFSHYYYYLFACLVFLVNSFVVRSHAQNIQEENLSVSRNCS